MQVRKKKTKYFMLIRYETNIRRVFEKMDFQNSEFKLTFALNMSEI